MFAILLMKEIRETIVTGKFFIATALCLVLIPLGMYVTLKEYEQRLASYQNAEQLYQQRSEGRVSAEFEAEGYRPPSPLSVFAFGLEQFLPNKAVTSDGRSVFGESMNGLVKITNESSLQNPMSVLFGKMDFLFNVGFVLSIFVFLSISSTITGEREQGTLKLVMSNSVPRWVVLVAKITGNYVVFLTPFLVSFMTGLVIIGMSGSFPLNDTGILPAVLIILAVAVMFLLCLYTLGVLVSASTHNSNTAVFSLLFIWTIFALVVPRLSPMVAQIIKPVELEQVIAGKIRDARMELKIEQIHREDYLFLKVLNKYGFTNKDYLKMPGGNERTAIETEYDTLVLAVREEYAEKMSLATMNLQREYNNAVREQEHITTLISRASPICCFTYVLTELAGTGIGEISNFSRQAEQFQGQVTQTVYDKYWFRQYGAGMYNVLGFWVKPGVDADNLPVPQMNGYLRTTVAGTFAKIWPDVLLLMLYTALFFVGAFVKFLRYDVR